MCWNCVFVQITFNAVPRTRMKYEVLDTDILYFRIYKKRDVQRCVQWRTNHDSRTAYWGNSTSVFWRSFPEPHSWYLNNGSACRTILTFADNRQMWTDQLTVRSSTHMSSGEFRCVIRLIWIFVRLGTF